MEATFDLRLDKDKTPITPPQFSSHSTVYGIHDNSLSTAPSWEADTLTIDHKRGSQITNDASPQEGALRTPYVEFEPQNRGLLQYRIEFMWTKNGEVQGYNTFDPFINITE